MADVVDQTSDRDEAFNEMKIRNIQQAAARQDAEATGKYLTCGDQLDGGRRWCDFECMSEWELDRRMRTMR